MPLHRLLLRATLLPFVFVLGLASTVLPAGAGTVHQVWTIPAGGAFTLKGHGFGHGHGMSQYGAQGAALQGLTANQILAFYYPGTTLSTSSDNIAVLITADTTRDVIVLAQSGLSVTDLGTQKKYPLTKAGATRWRLNVDAAGKTLVAYYSDGWHNFVATGMPSRFVGDGKFSAPSGLLTLVTPSGNRVYRGALRAASPSTGSTDRDTVNILPIDQYVKGVVASEMPASWKPAAVQAQAVAARTYGLRSRADARAAHRYYDICDTTACQVYQGVGGEDPRGNDAVTATAGRYLSYQSYPAFTQFSSSSGGWTSKGSQSYLPHQADPYDGWSGNGMHSWSVKVNESVLEHRYPKIGDLKTIVVTSREGGGDWGGRVWSANLNGTKGSVTVSGDDIRSAYGLRSTWFGLG